MTADPTDDAKTAPATPAGRETPGNHAAADALARVRGLKVPIIVQLAGRRIPVATILQWGRGTIVEFGKSVETDIDLLVGNRPVARGEAVKVGEKFGLRVTAIGAP